MTHCINGEESMREMVAAGAIPALVRLLSTSSSAEVQQAAARTLANLTSSRTSDRGGSVKAAVAAGAVPSLVQVLSTTDAPLVVCEAAWALNSLANENPPGRAAIAAAGGIPALVGRLCSTDSKAAQEAVATLLGNLAGMCPSHRKEIAAAGVIPILARLLAGSGDDASGSSSDSDSSGARSRRPGSTSLSAGVREAAAEALSSLAGSRQIRQQIADLGCLPALVQHLSDSTYDWLLEHIALLFCSLANDSSDSQQALVAAGAIPPLQRLQFYSDQGVRAAAEQALQALGAGGFDPSSAAGQPTTAAPQAALLPTPSGATVRCAMPVCSHAGCPKFFCHWHL